MKSLLNQFRELTFRLMNRVAFHAFSLAKILS
jgi:hypothetical protein